MGWLWRDSNKDDPVKKLDPELRDYLKHETPSTSHLQEPSKQPAVETADQSTGAEESKPRVPPKTLFPDGRYAHIWENYRPLEEVEGANTMGAAERVVEKSKARKGSLQKAAMENCALEYEDLTHCFHKGDFQKRVWNRLTLCSEANKRFNRCFSTQAVRVP